MSFGQLWSLDVADQAVEVAKSLVEPLTQVLELLDALTAIGQELVDPLQDDRAADLLASTALDFRGLLVGQHGRS